MMRLVSGMHHLLLAVLLACLCLASPPAAHAGQNNRALLIGISQYAEINGLRYADSDVRAFSQLLSDFAGYQKSDVDLLLNQQATKAHIVAEINRIIRDSKKHPIDHFILMFAGHGVPNRLNGESTDVFLAPFDASTSDNDFYSTGSQVVNETFISKAWLARQLSAINAKSTVIIIDSCYSGTKDFGKLYLENMGYKVQSFGVHGSGSDRGVAVVRVDRPESAGKDSNREIAYIASSQQNQASAEYDQLGHGALSYCILQYISRVQQETYSDQRKRLTVGNIYSNITNLFHEVKVDGQTLASVQQPLLLGIPSASSARDLAFLSVQGVRKREIKKVETGSIDISTDPEGLQVSVDGIKQSEVTDAHLTLTAGKHMIGLFMPNTGYRYTFTTNIAPSRTIRENISMRGSLKVASYWLKNGQKSPGPQLDVYIDGVYKGKSFLHLDHMLAGTHILRVRYKNVTKQRQIEIRPDSPLRVNYSVIRKVVPAPPPDDNGIGNVVF